MKESSLSMNKLQEIKLIVYDFDGVMTDNRVFIDENGKESVVVNRSDGLAVSLIKKMNIQQVIISTEKNPIVSFRAKKLNIDVYYGVNDKALVLNKYCKEKEVSLENVIYIGNDLNDLEVMKIVGLPIAPFDAYAEIKEISKYILKTKGGFGVIRELYNLILEKNKLLLL